MEVNGMSFKVQKAEIMEETIQTELLIIFLLEGEMTVKYLGEKHKMKSEDIILINPGVSYEILSTHNAIYGVASFSMNMIAAVINSNNTIFYCNSMNDDRHSYEDLRNIMFSMTAEFAAESHRTRCYIDSLLLKLLDCLVENYQLNKKNLEVSENDNDYRIREIMQYIMANLDKDISLNDLAASMFVSTSTLSRIFKKNMGVYFADYVMQLRIKIAIGYLEYTDQNMTQIALSSGFSNSATFNRAFRKVMGETPSEYREKNKLKKTESEKQEIRIREELKEKGYDLGKKDRTQNINLNVGDSNRKSYKKNWNKMINIGPIWDLNKANVQRHIIWLSEHLHFKYIRIWNVLSKKMMITDGTESGKYNYDRINVVFDFLVENNLKPFLDFGRRPNMALRSDGNEVFLDEQYIDFESKEAWQKMIDSFIKHLSDRYGKDEVSEWIFELDKDFINNPIPLYKDKSYDFFDAWAFMHRTIKKRLPNASFGGIGGVIVIDGNYLAEFYERCVKENVKPDFVSFIVFPFEIKPNLNGTTDIDYSEDKQISRIETLLKHCKIEDAAIYITEWNNTISNRNYLNDSCFRAAYLVERMDRFVGKVDMVGIMSGTDLVSSHMDTVGIVNGGIGLLTKDNIRKPAYFAVDFLNQLGEQVLDKGEHYIITRKSSGDIYILCFYYSWFKRNYMLQDDLIDLNRYNSMVFEDENPLYLNFHLDNLEESGEYYIKKRTMNRQNGSILNEWGNFQYDNRLTIQDVKYLQGISIPTLTQNKKIIADSDRTLDIKLEIEPQEITLIHIFCSK